MNSAMFNKLILAIILSTIVSLFGIVDNFKHTWPTIGFFYS